MRSTSSIGFPTAGSASVAPNRFKRARDACVIGFTLVVVVGATLARGQELDVPVEITLGDKAGDMMSRYWLGEVEKATERWRAAYEARTAPEQIATYQAQLREEFLKAVGGLPERTPLNARGSGTIRREGYRVEKIIFESQPKHFVTALLFVPEANHFTPPYPGVLVPCGHARSAKAHDEYQSVGALLAAATEPGLFESVKLVRSLESWSTVIHGRLTDVQATQIVHGALQTYDLPDLAATLEDRLTVEQPTEAARSTFSADQQTP